MSVDPELAPELDETQVPDAAFFGPDQELLEAFGRAQYAPTMIAMDPVEQEELAQRVLAVTSIADLSPEDQSFLEEAGAEVLAGGNPFLLASGELSDDWAGEDAAVDDDDDVEDPAELDTGDTGDTGDTLVDTDSDTAEVKALGLEGWVGL